MKLITRYSFFICSGIMFFCFSVNAEINDEIKQLQQEWAEIKYTMDKKEHEVALKQLASKATAVRENQPKNADAHLWEGIIYSTYAGAIGTLRALKAVTHSRDALEQSILIDPKTSDGAAHTYLGTLYFLVPEWPIAFGDLGLAKKHLDIAKGLNPEDIDVNYYYAEYLKKKRKYNQAETYYLKAIDAPTRTGRDLADNGRRKEAKEHLEKVKVKIANASPKQAKQSNK